LTANEGISMKRQSTGITSVSLSMRVEKFKVLLYLKKSSLDKSFGEYFDKVTSP